MKKYLESKIPVYMMVIMVCTALLLDIIQILLTLTAIGGDVITILAGIIFLPWLLLYGVKFTSPKDYAVLFGGGIIEVIPVVNDLPTITLTVGLLILFTTRLGKVAETALTGDVIGATMAYRSVRQEVRAEKQQEITERQQAQQNSIEQEGFKKTQNNSVVLNSKFEQKLAAQRAKEKQRREGPQRQAA